MSGDYSRERFDPANDYSGILQQQGKVQLDSAGNELFRILERRGRAQTVDTIGRCVVPRATDQGFAIAISGTTLTIGRGRIYVDGLLAENHGVKPLVFDPVLAEQFGGPIVYSEQPYLPDPMHTAPPPVAGGPHLVYVVVHERELTYLQRPSLVEVAIGQDTVTAVQTVWQVRVLPDIGAGVTCATPEEKIPGWMELKRSSDGRLSTNVVDAAEASTPCAIGAPGGYRGLENQLYRIEVHDGGPVGKATFKWSRDNGTVATSVLKIKGAQLTVARTRRDAVLRFNVGDWVEITDDVRELDGRPGEMRRVTNVTDETQTIELATALPVGEFPAGDVDPARHLRICRWDQHGRVVDTDGNVVVQLDAAASTGVIPVPAAGTSVLIEHGVRATFDVAAPSGSFRAGDYWTFAARTADASIDVLDKAPPRGIHRHHGRLAVVTFPATVADCRVLWPPEQPSDDGGCACTVCITPEEHKAGRPSLQGAIDELVRDGQGPGGTICLGAGTYDLREPLRIEKAGSLRIVGQGVISRLRSEPGAIQIVNSQNVTLEDFHVECRGNADIGSAVTLISSGLTRLQRLTIETANRGWNAIGLGGALFGLVIRDNFMTGATGIVSVDDLGSRPGEGAFRAGTGIVNLQIEDNLFGCEETGIRLDQVTVHQHMSRISGNRFFGCTNAGLIVTGATVPGFGIDVFGNDFVVRGDGIRAGLDGLRVENNDFAIPSETPPTGRQRAVVLTRGVMTDRVGDGQIISNRIMGFSEGISGDVALGSLVVTRNYVTGARFGLRIKAEGLDSLVIDRNEMSTIERAAIVVTIRGGGHVGVSGNHLDTAAGDPAILIECGRGDCLFANNHFTELTTVSDKTVVLTARTVALTSNRFVGRGVNVVIETGQHTVLGNMVGGEIRVNNGPLATPWNALNHENVV